MQVRLLVYACFNSLCVSACLTVDSIADFCESRPAAEQENVIFSK